eukprot:Nitzschia sp. Nitz4//scaffold549_size3348//1663//3261//NITZ4_009270-RA/size3348-processed-gene-0.5-mRNA-1//-1//CDS//3329554287//358//frame0
MQCCISCSFLQLEEDDESSSSQEEEQQEQDRDDDSFKGLEVARLVQYCQPGAMSSGGGDEEEQQEPTSGGTGQEEQEGQRNDQEGEQQSSPSEEESEDEEHDVRVRRSKRRCFDHKGTLASVQRDYLGPEPLFPDKQFKVFFRVSRLRFEVIMQDVVNRSQNPYYNPKKFLGASLEARLLLPLKTLAYGVAPHVFSDYFQMSFTQSRRAWCNEFAKTMNGLYMSEYLRQPTAADLKGLNKLHKRVHKVPGMLGSLDCSHTIWKNCPKAWQGSFQGKEGVPTVVLEATCDFNLWFWHASFGHAGTLNDKNILALSPLMMSFDNGNFGELEDEEAGVIPFSIEGEEFEEMYLLVDGIYPAYSRFVKSCPIPSSNPESYFSAWQESARKDIERAFGVLQGCFQWFKRPLLEWKLDDIAEKACTCLILHNMLVEDRVMGGHDPIATTYAPDYNHGGDTYDDNEAQDAAPSDLNDVQRHHALTNNDNMVGTEEVSDNQKRHNQRIAASLWENTIVNQAEGTKATHQRLHQAMIDRFY